MKPNARKDYATANPSFFLFIIIHNSSPLSYYLISEHLRHLISLMALLSIADKMFSHNKQESRFDYAGCSSAITVDAIA
jgi:hypothetical protein